ncbi:MAG TPA: IS1595 family transposase [Bacteroidia bacterium]
MLNKDFTSILDLIKAFPDEQTCTNHLEQLRWNGNVISPFDEASIVYKCKGNKYKCKNTGKYFNVRTATLFDNTKVELQKWFLAIYIVTAHKKGISSHQLARDLDVTQKTAWFMLQRIRACFGLDNLKPEMIDNTQLDETFVGGKNKNRHANKKVANSQGRSFKDKAPVMGMLSDGMVQANVVPDTTSENIQPIILKTVPHNTTIISDEWSAYNGLSKHYTHEVVEHRANEFVNDCGFTTNSLEGFWSLLKRGIIGIYHFTSKKHLQKYVDEFAFRYNSREMKTNSRFNLLLANTEYRLTYKNLIK